MLKRLTFHFYHLLHLIDLLKQFHLHTAEAVVLLEILILSFTNVEKLSLARVVLIGLRKDDYTLWLYLLSFDQILNKLSALVGLAIV